MFSEKLKLIFRNTNIKISNFNSNNTVQLILLEKNCMTYFNFTLVDLECNIDN